MAVELVVPGKYPAVVILRELMYSLYSAMESFRKKKKLEIGRMAVKGPKVLVVCLVAPFPMPIALHCQ